MGGFMAWGHTVKLILGFTVPALIILATTLNWQASLLGGLMVGCGLLFDVAPKGYGFDWLRHAYGQRMGSSGPSTIQCVLGMGARYGLVTLLTAWLLSYVLPNPWLYAPVGFFVPFGYFIASRIWPNGGPTLGRFGDSPKEGVPGETQPNYFLDGYTTVGELWLGLLVIDGLILVG
ncbi:MAG: hypothetical protein AB7Q04_13310 [Steroidobacteraceae bacterium]